MLCCYCAISNLPFFWLLVRPILLQGKLISTLIVTIGHMKERLCHIDTRKVVTILLSLARSAFQDREYLMVRAVDFIKSSFFVRIQTYLRRCRFSNIFAND
ncbi:MAG: hypothetical protein EXX96DRAFT_536743 [Benjaminiella poitrasii]|nr:MAG: hypothetical protein EXX96DRAFT_536743 [Benjaminiella poitrasii]